MVFWSYDWDFNFNLFKCDVLKIFRKRNLVFCNYIIEVNVFSEINLVKDLGVVILSILLWYSYVILIVVKCNKILGFFR